MRVLPSLTEEHLNQLGVASLWHLGKLLDAVGQQTRPRFKGWGDEHGKIRRGPALVGRLSYAAPRDATFTAETFPGRATNLKAQAGWLECHQRTRPSLGGEAGGRSPGFICLNPQWR
jgi:hypothetical protein